ncbi:hypothetical protein N7G274_004993 [Stereocaulon virgatum]|uniref:DUF6594 domain-containing protein n=1 Tax=Stereocaulon virgatum TaxID=373712 RepID=A0ABR4A9P8_9LECA
MFGGLAPIEPMLIIILNPSRKTSLITLSIATVLFALALAFITKDTSGKDVLGATAAYAAALVVFVRTSMAPAVSGQNATVRVWDKAGFELDISSRIQCYNSVE